MHSLERAALWIFALSTAAMLYVYIGYPVLLWVLSLFVKRKQAKMLGDEELPALSMLIAAYNEEGGIRKKLEETLALNYPKEKLQILVLSDSSSDRTDDIVREFSDRGVELVRVSPRKGKTNAQNHGVQHATGEILIFSDATTTYHPLALRYLASNYTDPKVGAVSGRYKYFDATDDSPTSAGTIAFWNYENFIKMMQSRLATITGCCGCIYSVRKAAYTPLPADIISDLVQPLCAIRKGYRVVFEDRALAFEETTQSNSEEFSMRVRVVTRGMRGLLYVRDLMNPLRRPWIALQLLSHKVLRWAVALFLVAIFVSSIVLVRQPVFTFLVACQCAFYTLAGLQLIAPAFRKFKPLLIPLYFCTVNAAAVVSLFKLLRGVRYAVWETVRTEQR